MREVIWPAVFVTLLVAAWTLPVTATGSWMALFALSIQLTALCLGETA